jgi:O-antigen/teichoic acid export membrane protein
VLHIIAGVAIVALSSTLGLYYIKNHLVVEVGKLNDAYFVFIFSVFNALAQIVSTPFRGLLVANEKFAITVPIEIGTKVAVLAIAIALNYIPSNHLRFYVVFITIAHYLNPFGYVVYCFKNFYGTVRWKFQRGIKHYKAMFNFAGWNMIGTVATLGEHQGSAVVINSFFGTILNASFGIANQINATVQMFAQSLGEAIVPQITKSYSSGNHQRSADLVIMASKYSFFLIAIPMLPILLDTDFILNIWLKQVPAFTSIFVKAMLIRSMIGTSQFGIGSLIHASGNIRLFTIVSSGIMLLSLPISYVAFVLGYPPYAISYVYIFVSIITFCTNQLLLKVVLKYDSLKFLSKSTIRILLVCLFQVPVFMIMSKFNSGLSRFVIATLISEVTLIVSIILVGMNREERAYLSKVIALAHATIWPKR